MSNIRGNKKFNKKARRNELDKLWSLRVRERDNFICQQCLYEKGIGKPDHKNHTHHIVSKATGGYGCRWDIDNGITLCYKHHIIKIPQAPITYTKFILSWLKDRKLNYDDMKYNYNETFVKLTPEYYKLKKESLNAHTQQ